MDNNSNGNAWVKLYHPSGALVTLPLPMSREEIAAVCASVDAAIEAGFLVSLPGTEAGERVEDITGWVLGETSREEPCVYLYGAQHLKYRVVTVWAEDMHKLPIQIDGMSRWIGAAPEREMAEKKGVLHPVSWRAVLKPAGQTEDGKDRWRFDRLLSAEQLPAPAKQPPAPSEQPPAPAKKPPAPAAAQKRSITPQDIVDARLANGPHAAQNIMNALCIVGKDVETGLKAAYLYRAWRNAGLIPQDAAAKTLAAELPVGFDAEMAKKFIKDALRKEN